MTRAGGNWDLSGVHGINAYIWHLLQTELGWTATPYGGLVPITNPQQAPEFNALAAPYIVYSYSKMTSGETFFFERETIAYSIFSSSESDVRKVVNMLSTILNKFDDSAKECNNYLSLNGTTNQKFFDYKVINVTSANGAQPALQEGGRYDGLIVVKCTYTHSDPATGIAVRY